MPTTKSTYKRSGTHGARFSSAANGWVAIAFPYDAEYVAAIKRIVPAAFRKWDPVRGAWLTWGNYQHTLAVEFERIEKQRAADDGTLEGALAELFALMPSEMRNAARLALANVGPELAIAVGQASRRLAA